MSLPVTMHSLGLNNAHPDGEAEIANFATMPNRIERIVTKEERIVQVVFLVAKAWAIFGIALMLFMVG